MFKKSLLLAITLCAAAPWASANTVTSAEADCLDDGLRVFSVTADTVDKCLLSGDGNINGGTGNGQNAGQDAAFIASGWELLDNTDEAGDPFEGWLGVTGNGETSGTFTIDADAYAMYDFIAIGFKVGVVLSPDFAIFQLDTGTLGGDWSVTPKQGAGLSHAILYGFIDGGGPPNEVPEPGSLALAGLALLGGALARRRR